MSDETAMQQLLDRQAVADVMSHYARAIDERNLAYFENLFFPDVRVVGFGPRELDTLEDWLAFVTRALSGFVATQHMLGPPLAVIEGDTALARTDLQATHVMKAPKGEIFTLWGTYETGMRREAKGGAWRIARHELVVCHTENLPGT
jgi:ketosteroid isomerase-like protein